MKKSTLWMLIACCGVCWIIIIAIAAHLLRKHHDQVAPARNNQETPAQQLGTTPTPQDDVYLAARSGDLASVIKLLDAHPDLLNAHFGKDQSSLLNTASFHKHIDVVKELLRRNADVNIFTAEHKTPLWDAADANSQDIVALLLEAGADPSIASSDGRTPLQDAVLKNRTAMADFLRQHGVKQ